MKKIYFCNVKFIGNAGDYWASPLHYYDFTGLDYEHISFVGDNAHEIKDSIFVIGGGGLIITKTNYLNEIMTNILDNNKVIFWGIGSNTSCSPYYDLLSHPNVILSSTRDIDFNLKHRYVPCVSCKHKLFDKTYLNPKGVGILEHVDYGVKIKDYDRIKNNSSIEEIVDFISKKETIISSTYHGVYWSQLLNKKVVYYNDDGDINSKFLYLKNRIPICNQENYLTKIENLSHVEGMVKECRVINDEFYNNVMSELNKL